MLDLSHYLEFVKQIDADYVHDPEYAWDEEHQDAQRVTMQDTLSGDEVHFIFDREGDYLTMWVERSARSNEDVKSYHPGL